MRIVVIGATGKTGRYLVRRLCDAGEQVVALSRDAARLAGVDARADRRIADVTDASTVVPALAGADCVVSLAHAVLTEHVLGVLPPTCRWVVLTGSVRRSTALPDPGADGVRKGEAAFRAWRARGGRGVMLHPSMIYGAPEDRNIGRLIRFLRRWPRAIPVVVPLPGGGRHTVQPVYFGDLVEAMFAAIHRRDLPPDIEIVGPEPIPYYRLVQATAAAVGRRVFVLPVPLGILAAMAEGANRLGLRLPFNAAELRRGTEDKRFSPEPMRTLLGVPPRPFETGVREKVAQGWY